MSEPARLQALPPSIEVKLPLAQVLKLAQDYGQAGRHDDSEELLRAALRAAPRDPNVLHLTGIAATVTALPPA